MSRDFYIDKIKQGGGILLEGGDSCFMRKRILCIIPFVLLLFSFTACSTVRGVIIENIDTEENIISVNRGKEYQTITSEDGVSVTMVAQPTFEGDEIQVTVGILNPTEANMVFLDSSVSLYRGDYIKDSWKLLGNWNANDYYQKVYQKERSRVTFAAIAGALATINTVNGTISNSKVTTPYGISHVTTRTYNPAITSLAAIATAERLDSLTILSKRNLEVLQNTLLYSSEIASNTYYIGNLFIPVDNSSPEYKLVFSFFNGEEHSFLFSRSDRYAVTHPYSDQTRNRHSITVSHAIPSEKWQLTYFWSRKNAIGVYCGISLYNLGKLLNSKDGGLGNRIGNSATHWHNYSLYTDPDNRQYEANYTPTSSSSFVFGLGFPFGITYRVLANTWLMVGIDCGLGAKTTEYNGTLQYKIKETSEIHIISDNYKEVDSEGPFPIIAPQVGLNLIFNFIDVNLVASYEFSAKKFFVDLGLGIAF